MALDVEGVVDGSVNRQEPLGRSGRLEALLFSFSPPDRLMGILRPIVRAQSLIVNRRKPFLANGDGVRFELVRGDALRREALLLEQLSEQSPRRSGAASRLHQEVQHLALVVDSAPQPMFPAADLDNHLVEMPACTGTRTAAAKIAGDQPPKFQEPAPDGLV